MLLSLSWKNIWRNKSRSLVVTIAVFVGMFGGLFFTAFMKGLVHQRIESAITNECSNIQIHKPQYLLNKELQDTIEKVQSITDYLDTVKAVKAYSKRIKFIAMAASANASHSVILLGVDPEKEKKVTNIWKLVPDTLGKYFDNSRKNSAVIGHKLAEKLKLKLKSKLILTFPSDNGEIINAAFKIVGIYKTANSSFDESHVFVRKDELSLLLGDSAARCHEIAIVLNDDKLNKNVREKLMKAFPVNSVMAWGDIMPDLAVMNDKGNAVLYVLMVIILLALSFGIINTMLMAVLERTKEIGMLMAVGMKRIKVFAMIMLETILLMCTGTALGIGVSIWVVNYFSVYGIDLSAFAEGLSDAGFSSMVYTYMSFKDYTTVVILVLVAGILASIVPSRRALKLNPADAIRTI